MSDRGDVSFNLYLQILVPSDVWISVIQRVHIKFLVVVVVVALACVAPVARLGASCMVCRNRSEWELAD